MNALASAVIGAPGKARGRGRLVPARTSNAAWHAERGAGKRVALSPKKLTLHQAVKISLHAALMNMTSGQLPFLGLMQP
ncbi:MAG: hypothetical protein R3F09_18055 [Burkholderiaceae bacterium]|nr:hypothetical protein [Ottowia sp.]MCB2032270.1 hypothetical protein [Ottowia sp.]